MEETIKIIISGLDGAGKTSILTALDKKYDFEKALTELKPTIKVEYNRTSFLGSPVNFWDMGGQSKYRELYVKRQEIYFDGTNLILYIIDIQDDERFEESLNYLDLVLSFFLDNDIDIPLIVSFHKYDPEIRGQEKINNNIEQLRELITNKYSMLKILFQLTSIYDIVSIVQLISYGLSVFDEKFFDLSELLENYIDIFNCASLILFDANGIIISEFYSDSIDAEIYIELLESIKEHLFLLKRMQEENYELDSNFFEIEDKYLSYLHRLVYSDQSFFISVLTHKKNKEKLLDKFAYFIEALINVFDGLLSS
ncbi:MAG: ADP-ribosylation factor-like protein [Promethearchaeota archaeon]